MISSLLQLGELGPRLEDYHGQRWLFSSPLSPHSTRPHSGQNCNSYHYLNFSVLLLFSLLHYLPSLSGCSQILKKDIKIKSKPKVQRSRNMSPF